MALSVRLPNTTAARVVVSMSTTVPETEWGEKSKRAATVPDGLTKAVRVMLGVVPSESLDKIWRVALKRPNPEPGVKVISTGAEAPGAMGPGVDVTLNSGAPAMGVLEIVRFSVPPLFVTVTVCTCGPGELFRIP